MDDMPFGLARKDTYAALSAGDLEDLGKEASSVFLCDGTPLNDAVIKVAREHPSISPHQIKRVIEYANTDTFQRLFDKQADDKNIDFDVADPGVILRNLDLGARGGIMTPQPNEYSSEPVKLAHVDVEADIELAKAFGIDISSPGAEAAFAGQEKTASVVDRFLMAKEAAVAPPQGGWGNMTKGQLGWSTNKATGKHTAVMSGTPMGAMYKKMEASNKAASPMAKAAMAGQMIKQAMGGLEPQMMAGPAAEGMDQSPEAVGSTGAQGHHDQMLEMTRNIELEKKKQELVAIQQKTLESMGPGAGGAMPGGAPGGAPGGDVSVEPPPEVAAAMQGAPSGGPQGGPAAGPPGAPVEEGPQATPIQAPQGPVPEKLGHMIKSAMTYAKSGRPHASLVLADLAESTSLDRIKEATADRNPDPLADPYAPLIGAHRTLTKLSEDANTARDRNEYFIKDAAARWCHEVTQHILREDRGTGFGDVAHAMAHVDDGEASVKMAMAYLVPHLESKGIDPAPLQAQSIRYEMEKGASTRRINPNSPIVQSYANLIKLGSGQSTMEVAADRLQAELAKVNEAIKEAVHASSL